MQCISRMPLLGLNRMSGPETCRSLSSGSGGSMHGGATGLDHQAMARQQMEQRLREMQVTADLVQQQRVSSRVYVKRGLEG